MKLYIGTSGYSYKEWKGPFYPNNLPAKDMLQFYCANLPAVEINNTFYRMPTEGILKKWTELAPRDFRFVLKAPRKITHQKPLKEKEDEVRYFYRTTAALDGKLGAVLFQLPPYLHRDIELFADFIHLLPFGSAAFEFRHRSWFDDKVFEILQDKGCAFCCSDSEKEDLNYFVSTAGWGYLRLRREVYTETEFLEWAEKIAAQRWQAVYVFFKHEDEGAAPRMAKHFLDLANARRPSLGG